MIRRHLVALLHRSRCDRGVLLPVVERLSDAECEALYRLLMNTQHDAERAGSRSVLKAPWRLR